MNYLDLFSGIGGFAKGIEDAGIKIENHFFSEIDKNAISIYQKHFPNAIGVGDVSTIRDVSQFGKIDLITFGFPCQDLSIAGKGRGLAGARSGLFFEAIRLVRELKPAYFVFENVKGLLTSERGADFIRCLREIADIGCYDCEWQLVNTSWVLPQNRERIYFIGHLRGKSAPKVFPFTESDFEDSRIQGQQACCLTARYGEAQGNGTYIIERELQRKTKSNSQGQRINTIEGNSVCLSSLGGGMGAKTGLYVVPRGNNQGGYKEVDNCPTITKSSFETNNFICPVLTPMREEKRQNGRRFKENGEPSFTLTTQDQHGIFDGVDIRRLTPLECERLQGFPDGWTALGGYSEKAYKKAIIYKNKYPKSWARGKRHLQLDDDGLIDYLSMQTISDSARYKALGNAVSVTIVKMIMKRLFS